MSEISIELDKTDVCAGETIRGKVVLQVVDAIPSRGVRLKLEGCETSIRHTGLGRSTARHQETAVWFSDELTLAGSPREEIGSTLADAVKTLFSRDRYPLIEPGTYEYPFEYTLPDHLPGDYESTRGDVAIRYELRAYVDIPLRVDIEASRLLTVYETLRHADDADSASVAVDKQCLVPRGGHVLLKADIDRHAYKLGDDVRIRLDIDNQCNQLVDGAIVSLKQVETVQVHGESETREVVLASETFANCKAAPHEHEKHEIAYKVLPELYPSIEEGRLVKVDYAIHIELEVDLAVNPIVEIPVRLYEDPGRPGGQA